MQRLTNNTLLLGILCIFATYVLVSLAIPNPVFAVGMSIFLILCALLAVRRFARTSYDIIVNKLRNAERDGSHLFIVGVFSLAFGAIYTGLYSIVWEYAARPDAWVGTWYSRFGQFVQGAGFLCLAFSPDFSEGPPKIKNIVLVTALFFISVTAAFVAGNRIRTINNFEDGIDMFKKVHGENYSMCPQNMPYWVSRSGKVHGPYSKWRSLVVPWKCYQSQQEAMSAGYPLAGLRQDKVTSDHPENQSTE